MEKLVICSLIVWRLTHLIQGEDGPKDIIVRLRMKLNPKGLISELLACFMCLSVWLGVGMAYVAYGYRLAIPYGLALSGAAILLQLATGDK